jgi:hypothetical protein
VIFLSEFVIESQRYVCAPKTERINQIAAWSREIQSLKVSQNLQKNKKISFSVVILKLNYKWFFYGPMKYSTEQRTKARFRNSSQHTETTWWSKGWQWKTFNTLVTTTAASFPWWNSALVFMLRVRTCAQMVIVLTSTMYQPMHGT